MLIILFACWSHFFGGGWPIIKLSAILDLLRQNECLFMSEKILWAFNFTDSFLLLVNYLTHKQNYNYKRDHSGHQQYQVFPTNAKLNTFMHFFWSAKATKQPLKRWQGLRVSSFSVHNLRMHTGRPSEKVVVLQRLVETLMTKIQEKNSFSKLVSESFYNN